MQHDGSSGLPVALPSPSSLLLLLALMPIFVSPVAAAPVKAAAERSTASPPATEAEMNLYARTAALNVCIARAAAVEFDKAVAIAGETIAQVIEGQHGGVISVLGKKALTLDELRKGSINSAVIGAVEICPKQVPADVVKTVEEALRKADPARQAGVPTSTPTTK